MIKFCEISTKNLKKLQAPAYIAEIPGASALPPGPGTALYWPNRTKKIQKVRTKNLCPCIKAVIKVLRIATFILGTVQRCQYISQDEGVLAGDDDLIFKTQFVKKIYDTYGHRKISP